MPNEKEKTSIDENNNTPIKVIPLNFLKECKAYRVVEEFSSAKYKLSNLELKIWLIFLSELINYEESDKNDYTFDPTHIADLLHMDTHQARTSIIVEACKSLSQKYIEIINPTPRGKHNKHDWITFPLFSSVAYDSTNDLLHVSFNQRLHEALFLYARQAESILIDLKNIISVKRVNAMRALIVIKDMDEKGINSIDVNEFKQLIAESNKYSKFKDFKKRVLVPIEKDICSNTEYINFSFSDNGSPGVKASKITFTLKNDKQEKEEQTIKKANILESLRENVSATTFSRLSSLNLHTLDYISLAIWVGFQTEYIAKLPLENEELIVKNIETTMNYIKNHLNKGGRKFTKEECGRLIYSAIMKNQANVQTQENLPAIDDNLYENPTQYNIALQIAANKYIKNMSNNEYMTFYCNNKASIENVTHCSIELDNILKRDARKSDYKKIVQYVIYLHEHRYINLFKTYKHK